MSLKGIRNTLILLGITIITLGLNSCTKPVYNQLSDEDMSWLVYKNNEVVNFRNGMGDNLTYNVVIRTKAYRRDGKSYNEFTSAQFQQVNDTTPFKDDSKGELHLSKDGGNFLVTLTWPHFPIKTVPINALTPTAGTVGGINYTDLYVIPAMGFTDVRFYIESLTYSKSAGVVELTDTFGNTWVRDF